jgi:hypothetical protein
MNRMTAVRITRGLVVEFHHAAELVPLPAGRSVFADPGFQDAGDLGRQLADFFDHMFLLVLGDIGLKSKGKHMDVHDRVRSIQKIAVVIFGDDAQFVNRDSTIPSHGMPRHHFL